MTKSVKAKKERKIAKLKPILKLSRKLKKAQNETRTEFKTRKIIMKEQLEDQPNFIVVDKKNLSIKDLIARLNHHNTIVKKDAIDRIREIVQLHKPNVYGSFVPAIVKGLGPCLFNLTSSIRKASIRCINVLIQMCRSKVEPFLDFLVSYASCAMVHINVEVQEDSLLIIDSIRIMVPLMKTDMVNLLLSNFLGLICRKIKGTDGDFSSELVFNPDNALTHINWRAKMLDSLNTFLSTILKHYGKSDTSTLSSSEMILHNSFPSIGNIGNDLCQISIFTNAEEAKNFTKNVIEILNITWIETSLHVFRTKGGKGLSQTDVYEIILNILNHLQNIANIVESNDPTECHWFVNSIKKDFRAKIISGFPYSTVKQIDDKETSDQSWDLNISIATLAMNLFEKDPTLKLTILKYFIGILNNPGLNKQQKMENIINVCYKLLEKDCKVELKLQEALLAAALNCFRVLGTSPQSKSYVNTRELILALPIRAAEWECGQLRRSHILMQWVKELVEESNEDWPAIKTTLIALKLRNPPHFRETIISCRS